MASTFEEDYFYTIYGRNYIRRNPPYKWRGFLKEILKYCSQGKLLDVGCAYGLFLNQAAKFFECTGCDISFFALKHAHEKLPKSVSLFQGALGEIPHGQLYDIVTCFDIIEHIPDLSTVWANLYRLVKPGGILVVTVPVYDGPLGWLVNILDKDTSHVHRTGRMFWLSQVKTYFELKNFLGVWRYFFFNRFYLNIISSRSRFITPAIMLIAEKN